MTEQDLNRRYPSRGSRRKQYLNLKRASNHGNGILTYSQFFLLLVCGWTTVAHTARSHKPAINLEFTRHNTAFSEKPFRASKEQQIHILLRLPDDPTWRRASAPKTVADLRRPAPGCSPRRSLTFDLRHQIALIPAARKGPGRIASRCTVNDSPRLPRPASPSRWRATIRAAPCRENNGSFTITVPNADAVLSFTLLFGLHLQRSLRHASREQPSKVFLAEDAVKMEDVVVG